VLNPTRGFVVNRRTFLAGLPALAASGRAAAQEAMTRDYISDAEGPWRYLSDQVMGGVSEGRAEAVDGAIRLTGSVSTANRGGFIQVRTEIATPLPDRAQGVALEARGNGERYFVHLRTTGTRLPWQYYQAGFHTGREWREVRLPWSAFRASGRLLRGTPRAPDITSVGLVAYGRDHGAELEVRRLWFW
jgi:hypothetical protein